MANYNIWLCEPDGTRIKQLQPSLLEFVTVYGDVGAFVIELPHVDEVANQRIPDRRVEIWRTPNGGQAERVFYGFIRAWEPRTESNGAEFLTLSGEDGNSLLKRRIIAYAAATSQATATAEATDNLMKRVVDESMVASGTAARNLAIVTKDPNTTDGVTITKAFAWKNLLQVLQSFQAASRDREAEVFFAMEPDGAAWVFRTYTAQPGNDRTSTGSTPLFFGEQWRNIDNLRDTEDYTNSASYAYAGGQGLESERNIQEVEDAALTATTPYGRIEFFITATQSITDNAVSEAGRDGLTERRILRRVKADILDTSFTPYGGAGWRVGDKITIDVYGRKVDSIIRSVRIRVQMGRETIKASIEGLD